MAATKSNQRRDVERIRLLEHGIGRQSSPLGGLVGYLGIVVSQCELGNPERGSLEAAAVPIALDLGPGRGRLVLEHVTLRQRSGVPQCLQAVESRRSLGVLDELVEANDVYLDPLLIEPIAAALGHDRRRVDNAGQGRPQERHRVLDRRVRIARKPVAPQQIDETLLRHRSAPG